MAKYSLSSKIIFLLLFLFSTVKAQNLSIASFSRLGFGSRGIALGNAMGSVTYGEVTGYYNPAVLPFANLKKASLTIGILSLDRNLDFLHYTQSLYPTAGFSIFLIRAGVKNIEARDADGYIIENLNTSEYLLGFSFSNRIVNKLSIGISLKFYYNKLYHEVKSQTLGIDFGTLFKLNDNISFAFSIHDLNAGYKWDSSIIYQEKGRTFTEKFPVTKRFSASYVLKDILLFSADLNIIGVEKKFNFGTEIFPLYFLSKQFKNIASNFCIRGGVEFFDYTRFSTGFGISRKVGNFTFTFDYTYKFERYAPSGIQFLTIGIEI